MRCKMISGLSFFQRVKLQFDLTQSQFQFMGAFEQPSRLQRLDPKDYMNEAPNKTYRVSGDYKECLFYIQKIQSNTCFFQTCDRDDVFASSSAKGTARLSSTSIWDKVLT